MKTIFTLFLLAVACMAEAVVPADEMHEQKVEAKPSAVTVFLTGAELGYKTSVKLKKGKNLVKFTGLSSKMDPGSIVVDVEDKKMVILSVYSTNNFLAQMEKNPKVKAVRDTLDNVKDRLAKVSFRKETLMKEKEMLFKDNYIYTDNEIASLKEYVEFCRTRRHEINEELHVLNKREAKLTEEVNSLNKQMTEMNVQMGMPSSEVMVQVDAVSEATVNMELKYRVLDAGWAPKYDIRVEGIGKPVNLYYKANIYNNSGVDWNEVKIKLSTADPMQGAQYPRMEGWDLKQNVTSTQSYQQAQKQVSQLSQENKNVKFTTIEVDELSAEFDIAQPYTIPSDSRPYLVDVNNKQLEARYEYVSVPKMDKDAFLVAKVVGWTELSLVSGKASVYYNGTYIGQSSINIFEMSDTLELSLGRDNKIAVSRIKKSELNDHQIIGNYEKEIFKYEFTVKNNRDIPVTMNLQDQVPMTNDSRVSVNISELSDGKYDKYSGQVNWVVTLQPGESKSFNFNFYAKYPKEFNENYRQANTFYTNNYNWIAGRKKVKFRTVSSPSF
ncbi:MAG: DUF4139 domain-containing protein [Bacteroidota bacterium]